MKNLIKISILSLYAVLSLNTFVYAQLQFPQYNVNNIQPIQSGITPVQGTSPLLLQNNGMQINGNNMSQGNAYGYIANQTQNNLINQQYNTMQTSSKVYSRNQNKSCQTAYAQSNGSYILDLSDTNDINYYGNSIVQDFINKAKEKKYDFVYIDLCNTNVNPMLVAQWNQLLTQNNIQVMWNLSNNSSINDYLFQYIGSLDNIKGLNISNTSVSVYGINILCQLLNNNTDSTIQFINICGLNVQNATYSLISAFNNHITLWKQKNNNQEYVVFKNAIIDNYNENIDQNYNTPQYIQQQINPNIGYSGQQQYTQMPMIGQMPYNNQLFGNTQQYTAPITSTGYLQQQVDNSNQVPQQYSFQNMQLPVNNGCIANIC